MQINPDTQDDITTGFLPRRQPSEYERPLHSPSGNQPNNCVNGEQNYDIPEGIQGLPLDKDQIDIDGLHDFKLPAEYNEISGSQNDITTGYDLITEENMSQSLLHAYETFPDDYIPDSGIDRNHEGDSFPYSSAANNVKSKTLAPTFNEYEIPLDAQSKSKTVPTSFDFNYETPIDATSLKFL